MPVNGEAAIGDIIEAETYAGSGVFFKFGEVRKLPPPALTAEVKDRTHMESPGAHREKTPGLIDPGNQSIEINQLPGNATEVYVTGWIIAREFRATRLTTKNGKRYSYSAYATSFAATGDLGTERTATIALEISGQVTPSTVG